MVFNEIAIAQSQEIKEINLTRLDSFLKKGLKDLCSENLTTTKKYKPSKIKIEQQIVSFLNKIYTGNFGQAELTKELFQLRKLKSFRETEEHGTILTERIVLRGPYLNSEIKLTFIDGTLVSAKTEIETGSNTRCGEYGYEVPDFYLFRKSYAGNFEFPVYAGYYGLTADTVFFDNIRKLSGVITQIRFLIPGITNEKWLDTILLKQYTPDNFCCYSYTEAPHEFIRLIRENKLNIIDSLLYSSNCLTAINAMEALIYLEGAGKYRLTPKQSVRIDELKNENCLFRRYGAPDVIYMVKEYSELKMTPVRIIAKYGKSF
jgi:hypothetical protein